MRGRAFIAVVLIFAFLSLAQAQETTPPVEPPTATPPPAEVPTQPPPPTPEPPTLTPLPGDTPADLPTATLLPSLTATFTETPTLEATGTASETATLTATGTETETGTATPEGTATATATASATALPPEPGLALLYAGDFSGIVPLQYDFAGAYEYALSSLGTYAVDLRYSGELVYLRLGALGDSAVQTWFDIDGAAVRLFVRYNDGVGGYGAEVYPDGRIDLTRAGQVVASTVLPAATSGSLRLSALGGLVRVSIDGVVVLSHDDPAPLPPGFAAFSSALGGEGSYARLTHLEVWVPGEEPGVSAFSFVPPEVSRYFALNAVYASMFSAITETIVTIDRFQTGVSGINFRGREFDLLTYSGLRSFEPAISPNSRFVAVRCETPSIDICIGDVNEELTPLVFPSNGTINQSPVWSDDGQHVAFLTRERTGANTFSPHRVSIHSVSAVGNAIVTSPVATISRNCSDISWAGNVILCRSDGITGTLDALIFNPDWTFTTLVVAQGGPFIAYPDIQTTDTPGNYLLTWGPSCFIINNPCDLEQRTLSVAGNVGLSSVQRTFAIPAGTILNDIDASPDGDWLAYVSRVTGVNAQTYITVVDPQNQPIQIAMLPRPQQIDWGYLSIWTQLEPELPLPTLTMTAVPLVELRDEHDGEPCHPDYLDYLSSLPIEARGLEGNAYENAPDQNNAIWRVQEYTENQTNNRRTIRIGTEEAPQAHHGIQSLWMRTIFGELYDPGTAPTILMRAVLHRIVNSLNIREESDALNYSWEQIWNEEDYAAYTNDDSTAEPREYTSLAFRMFNAIRTPEKCVELFKERLLKFANNLICRAVVETLIDTLPVQARQMRECLAKELGLRIIDTSFCNRYFQELSQD